MPAVCVDQIINVNLINYNKQMINCNSMLILIYFLNSNANNFHFQQDELVWCGLVESKIRFLIASLERRESIRVCHVHTKYYQPRNDPFPVQVSLQ